MKREKRAQKKIGSSHHGSYLGALFRKDIGEREVPRGGRYTAFSLSWVSVWYVDGKIFFVEKY